jgi:hypothetical protein
LILRNDAFDAYIRPLTNLGVINLPLHYLPLLAVNARLTKNDGKKRSVDSYLYPVRQFRIPKSCWLILAFFSLYAALWLL